MTKKVTILGAGCMISAALLIIFWGFKLYQPHLLELDAKWLTVAATPIIVALIIAGYISKFKFSGMELEMVGQKEVEDFPFLNNQTTDILTGTRMGEKLSVDELLTKDKSDREVVTVLSFELRLRNYYTAQAIETYLELMPNVRYFEFINKQKQFVGLVKIDRRAIHEYETVRHWIQLMQQGNWKPIGVFITDKAVGQTTTIIETYNIMVSESKDVVAIISEDSTYNVIGFVRKADIEKFLANKMLLNWRKQKKE